MSVTKRVKAKISQSHEMSIKNLKKFPFKKNS